MAKVQVWNPRSKKWILLDDEKKGGIIDMQDSKFSGVPVKNENQRSYLVEHDSKRKWFKAESRDEAMDKALTYFDADPGEELSLIQVSDGTQKSKNSNKNQDSKKGSLLGFFAGKMGL